MGDQHGRVMMGEKRVDCDDGATMLEVDWDGSPANYTCYSPTNPLLPRGTEPLLECDQLADDYQPQHFCMNSPIHYSDNVPTHGDHRPIWPKFGEYRFVPAQRWLHNIEHGAIVMLYHPCTHHTLVEAAQSCQGVHQETHHLSVDIGVRGKATRLGRLGMSACNGRSG